MKRTWKKMAALASAAAMTVSLAACGAPKEETSGTAGTTTAVETASIQTNADAKVVKYSVTFPSTGTQADGANALAEAIAECSDGRLKMEFYPSSQLGDKTATFEGLRAGTIEMTECAASDLSSFNDMWSVFSLPYLWEDGEEAIETVSSPEVAEYLEADAEKNGFKIIAWTNIGSRSILNDKKTVNTVDDLKGLKLRCMEDKLLADSVNAMGAIGTPMSSSEVYTAIQQGTIDGLDHTPSVIAANGWQELCKYFSLTEHFTIPDPVFVSKTWYDSLSEEDQKAIDEAGEKFADEWNNKIWPEATEEGLKTMEEAGVEITEVDKTSFRESVQGVVDDFLASASDSQKELYDLLTSARDAE